MTGRNIHHEDVLYFLMNIGDLPASQISFRFFLVETFDGKAKTSEVWRVWITLSTMASDSKLEGTLPPIVMVQ